MRKWLAMVVVVAAVGVAAVRQARARTCLEELTWAGDAELVADARRTLGERGHFDVPASACRGVVVTLSSEGGRVHLLLEDGERSIRHTLSVPHALASWMESWLLPTGGVAGSEAVSPPAPTIVMIGEPRPARAPARLPVMAALRLAVDVDGTSPLTMGAGLEIAVGFGGAWAGVAGNGGWSPAQDHVSRKALRLTVRGGLRRRLARGMVRLGAGLGLASAVASKREPGQPELVDDDAGPCAELVGTYERALGRSWALSFALAARAHHDLIATQPEDDPFAPVPLPKVALSFEVGLASNIGGGF